jgi:hypothetical protein
MLVYISCLAWAFNPGENDQSPPDLVWSLGKPITANRRHAPQLLPPESPINLSLANSANRHQPTNLIDFALRWNIDSKIAAPLI